MIAKRDLETLLDMAAQAIARADFGAAVEMAQMMEASLAETDLRTDPLRLSRLRQKADQNAACLLAARRGIRSARRRIEELRRSASGLATYDGMGRLAGLPLGGPVAGRF